MYYDIENLKLSTFISIYVTNNISLLVKSGSPTDEEITEYWREFLFDYYNKIGSAQSINTFRLNKNIVKLKSKISLLSISFNIYLHTRNPLIEKELKKIGLTIDSKLNDEQLFTFFDATIKMLEVEVKKMETELDNLNSKDEKGKPVTGETFTSNLIVLSKHNGYRIAPETITVDWYCQLLKQFSEHLKIMSSNGKH
jgi:hypothetical protein